MSNSKPLPSFILDTLNYLNRDQLDRFSIVCRPLKNLIDRYFSSKPYRIFHHLEIYGGSYALGYKGVHWHPNRENYSVQQFFAGQRCIGNKHGHSYTYYSFAQMRLYLGPTVRLSGGATIYVGGDIIYNHEHITEMESIAHLWRDVWINILSDKEGFIPTVAEDFQPILNSPTILKCRELHFIGNADFSFKDYQVLYAVDKINIDAYDVEINPKHWPEFLEKPGVKPLVILGSMRRENVANVLDRISKAFFSAVSPNGFKIVFKQIGEPLTEFQEMNSTSGEKLEFKIEEYYDKCFEIDNDQLNFHLLRYNYALQTCNELSEKCDRESTDEDEGDSGGRRGSPQAIVSPISAISKEEMLKKGRKSVARSTLASIQPQLRQFKTPNSVRDRAAQTQKQRIGRRFGLDRRNHAPGGGPRDNLND